MPRPRARDAIRSPRVAELVAGRLRAAILRGDYADSLPRQDDLFREFGVSMPSIREALRILETEGLIEVQRGALGGARVKRPEPAGAAYMLALVLQSRQVSLADVSAAIQSIEPLSASACASRADREVAVLPFLRNTLDAARAALDEPAQYALLARQFHTELVAHCGNDTMAIVVGALESLWTAHVDALAASADRLGSFADRQVREATAREHERLFRAIERGDAAVAQRVAAAHFGAPDREGRRHEFDLTAVIDATLLRP